MSSLDDVEAYRLKKNQKEKPEVDELRLLSIKRQAEQALRREQRKHWNEATIEDRRAARKLYVEEGYDFKKLARVYNIYEADVFSEMKAKGWQKSRKEFLRKVGGETVARLTSPKEIAEEMVQSDKEASEAVRQAEKAEALRLKDKVQSERLTRLQNQLAMALGIHEASDTIAASNPELALQERLELLTDRDKNQNYLRMLSAYFDSVKLQRLVDGQSTSAANKEVPEGEDDGQEHLEVVPLGGVQVPDANGETQDVEPEASEDVTGVDVL